MALMASIFFKIFCNKILKLNSSCTFCTLDRKSEAKSLYTHSRKTFPQFLSQRLDTDRPSYLWALHASSILSHRGVECRILFRHVRKIWSPFLFPDCYRAQRLSFQITSTKSHGNWQWYNNRYLQEPRPGLDAYYLREKMQVKCNSAVRV